LGTADNSGHTATLRFAQILPYGWTSYVRKPLSEIRLGDLTKDLKTHGEIL